MKFAKYWMYDDIKELRNISPNDSKVPLSQIAALTEEMKDLKKNTLLSSLMAKPLILWLWSRRRHFGKRRTLLLPRSREHLKYKSTPTDLAHNLFSDR